MLARNPAGKKPKKDGKDPRGHPNIMIAQLSKRTATGTRQSHSRHFEGPIGVTEQHQKPSKATKTETMVSQDRHIRRRIRYNISPLPAQHWSKIAGYHTHFATTLEICNASIGGGGHGIFGETALGSVTSDTEPSRAPAWESPYPSPSEHSPYTQKRTRGGTP